MAKEIKITDKKEHIALALELPESVYDFYTKWLSGELDNLFDEIRGLLKEHATFPNEWETDKHLKEWLKSKGEL